MGRKGRAENVMCPLGVGVKKTNTRVAVFMDTGGKQSKGDGVLGRKRMRKKVYALVFFYLSLFLQYRKQLRHEKGTTTKTA